MDNKKKFRPDTNLKLMDQVRQVLRYHHYAYRTEQAYCDWIVQYLKFFKYKKQPKEMGKAEIDTFLSYLATDRRVSASTRRQALNAVIFLYKHVLDLTVSDQLEPVRTRKSVRPPVVMTKDEVNRVFAHMQGIHLLMAMVLYGCGLRLMECIRLRIKDIDFGQNLIYVRNTKGGKDRTTLFPKLIQRDIQSHVEKVKQIYEQDMANGFGKVYIPEALSKKYPNASGELRWQYLFPSKNLSIDPRSGVKRRHHTLESGLQKAVKVAVERAEITKRVSCHTFRHSFATHMLENGVNIRILQELMGHADVKTTEIYTHVIEKDISLVVSPLDAIAKKIV